MILIRDSDTDRDTHIYIHTHAVGRVRYDWRSLLEVGEKHTVHLWADDTSITRRQTTLKLVKTNLESDDCQILSESFFTSERSHVTRNSDINEMFCDHFYILWHCCWCSLRRYLKKAKKFFSIFWTLPQFSLTHLFTRRPCC